MGGRLWDSPLKVAEALVSLHEAHLGLAERRLILVVVGQLMPLHLHLLQRLLQGLTQTLVLLGNQLQKGQVSIAPPIASVSTGTSVANNIAIDQKAIGRMAPKS